MRLPVALLLPAGPAALLLLAFAPPSAAQAGQTDGKQAEAQRIPYAAPVELGRLENQEIRESSGLAISRRRENVFFTHNDSGGRPRIFAFDLAGKNLGTWAVPGARALDWEDMASLKAGGKSYLLLADVGDNGARRPHCSLYLIEEPRAGSQTARLVQTVHFRYADGPHNCEAVAVDPGSGDIILICKTFGFSCKVFLLDWPRQSTKTPLTANTIATLKMPLTTAMDISPDGRRAIVLTYGNAYEYARRPGEDWAQAFARPGRLITMPSRKQGESICYGSDGKTLYLTSEHVPTPLFSVPVEDE